MNQIKNLSKLNNVTFFYKETLSQIMGIGENALSANIRRWTGNGILIQLKKGLYVTKEYYQSLIYKESYCEWIANIIKKPSYLSGEYILQKYSMLTESVFAITSVTRKKTKMYQNSLGTFLYSKIKDELFTGYKINNRDGFDIKEATKAKALFDFLYLRLWRTKEITKEIIESYRLNLEEMSHQELIEFKSFIDLLGIRKFQNLPNILEEISHDR
jgi:predicted transcriptional regulator of viral defense system